jgi:subtilisin family serine protease
VGNTGVGARDIATGEMRVGSDCAPRTLGAPTEALAPARLAPLVALGTGSPAVRIALVDGPVDLVHQALVSARLIPVDASAAATCQNGGAACLHGTSVAGLLAGADTGICPGCTILLRPIFTDQASTEVSPQPRTNIAQLTRALMDALAADAHVINLSLVVQTSGLTADADLRDVLDAATRRGVLVVAATGNSAVPTHSPLLVHRWVLPVVACDETGRLAARTQLTPAIRRSAIAAPGRALPSLVPGDTRGTLSGSSAAAAVVTGTAALLRSRFPHVGGAELRWALTRSARRGPDPGRPPLLDAWAAHQHLMQRHTFV